MSYVNDFSVAEKFLAEFAPNAKRFAFVSGDDGGHEEIFEGMTFDDLKQIIEPNQRDNHVMYVEISEDKFVALPGLLDVRTGELVEFDIARDYAKNIRDAGGSGEWAPGATKDKGVEVTPEGLSLEHKRRLTDRGLREATLDGAGLGTFTEKKTITKLLGKNNWGTGAVMVFPHRFAAGGEIAAQRVVLDNPAQQNMSTLWTCAKPVPYFPQQSLVDGRYGVPGVTYIVLDEIDTLVMTQNGRKAIGGEGADAFIDHLHLRDVGEERLHPSIDQNVSIAGNEFTIMYYPRAAGRKKHDAYRIANLLKQERALRVSLVEVTDGSLRKVAQDPAGLVELENTARVPLDDELRSPFSTVRDVLGEIVMTDPALKNAKALLVPENYDIDATGAIFRSVPAGFFNGAQLYKQERISRTFMFPTSIVRNFETGEHTTLLAYQSEGRWTARHVAMCDILRKGAIAELSNFGIRASDHNAMGLVAWFHDFWEVNEQHRRLTILDGFRRTGWHMRDDGSYIYAYPGITEGVFDRPGNLDGTARMFRARTQKRGTLEASCRGIQKMMNLTKAASVAVLAAFVGPCIERLDAATNIHIHVYGTTTGGKTLIVKVASSVMGNPHQMLLKGNATQNGLESVLAALSGTFVPVDETTTKSDEAKSDLAYMIVDGIGKLRMTKDGGTRDVSTWKTVIMTTGETPFSSEGMHQGAQARTINARLDPQEKSPLREVGHLITENYNQAHPIWLKYLETLDWDTENDIHRATVKRLSEQFQDQGANDRQACNAATLIWVQGHVQRAFGDMLEFPDATGEWLVDYALGDEVLRPTILPEYQRAFSALQTYVLEHHSQVSTFDAADHKGPCIARIRPSDGAICFEKGWITNFLLEQGFAAQAVRKDWEREGISKETQLRQGNRRPRYVIMSNEDFIDAAVSSTPDEDDTPPEPPTPLRPLPGGGGEGEGTGVTSAAPPGDRPALKLVPTGT